MAFDFKYGTIFHAPNPEDAAINDAEGIHCLGHEGEPVFIIRGQDVAAVEAISSYFDIAATRGASIEQSRERTLSTFVAWQDHNPTKIPD